jgi:uncharacterized Zn finger protein (UPF0148 family)
MSEETEETRFRYMLEFPNKIKVYCADEQLFSNLLEKYCVIISTVPVQSISAPVKPREHPRYASSPTTSSCPDCGSNRVRVDDERGDVICVDCGYLFSPQERANNPQDRSNEDARYKVLENDKSYLIVCKSEKASYTTSVSKSIVEAVYQFLKSQNRKLSAVEIGIASRISNVSAHNALRVLKSQGRAEIEVSSGFGGSRFLYKVVESGHYEQKSLLG